MPLDWQTVDLPLGSGLYSKDDARAGQPPGLDIARDAQFEQPLGTQTRLPYAAMSNNIIGGGTLSNCRFLAVVNEELCVFTDVALYSWSSQLSGWVLRGTHLAAATTERAAFVTTGDQIDADRAELNGVVVWAWTEAAQVYAAAHDKATGAVLVTPTAVSTAVGRARLVALSTKILLFTDAGASNLTVRAIDPASPSSGITGAGTSVLAANYNAYYDARRAGTQDLAVGACRRTVTTSYQAFTVTACLVVTGSTKARTADGPLAVDTIPDGTKTQVIRGNGTNIQGDLLTTSSLADIFTAQAIGTAATTPVNQITVAFSSVLVGGQFQATAWWAAGENGGTAGFTVKNNTVDAANSIGASRLMPAWLSLASHAFAYSGSIYAWLVFAGDSTVSGTGTVAGLRAQLQNTYFLYRADGLLVAKASAATAGGFGPSTGNLPGVAASGTTSYAWCGALRRVIDLGGEHTGYADRDPNEIVVTFDSSNARRSAPLGQALYITGGLMSQYDGVALTELGFQIYPWAFASAPLGGAVPAGTYFYECTLRWSNAQGEMERSTTATVGSFVNPGASKAALSIAALTATRKTGTVRPPAMEVWRTIIAPPTDPPFYLASSKDPAAVGDNGYIANDATSGGFLATFADNFTDAVLATKETNPENGNVLENLAPPPASIAIASDTRLFLAGIPGQPDSVWPSRLRSAGEIPSFHDGLVVQVPRAGGDITALAFLNDTLVVFRETATYDLPGNGFDNGGGGQNFGPATTLSRDVGAVNQESVVVTPMGVVFKSSKGWYLLDRGWNLKYIGAAVSMFDADTVLATHIVEKQHHVRILTSSRMLTWDYWNVTADMPLGQWAEWTIADGLHAIVWNGAHVYLTATGPKTQGLTYSGLTYGLDVETAWFKPAGLQGECLMRWFAALGEYRSAFLLRIRVARDYEYDGAGNVAYFDDTAWTVTPTIVGSSLQVEHVPSKQRCTALKIRLTAVTEAVRASLATATALSPVVATSGSPWAATWSAVSTLPGEMGNRVSMAVSFETGAVQVIDVRDHYTYDIATARWVESQNRIGVRIVGVIATPPTVATIEAAITNASTGTKLATLATPDATPSKTVNVSAMSGLTSVGSFTAGAYGSPTGEACRLTSIAYEFGVKRGINKRLPAGQKAA